jgi:ribosomal protein L11 methyltransferase
VPPESTDPDLLVELDVPPGADSELAADRLWQAGATAVEIRESGALASVSGSFPTADAARLVVTELEPFGARLVSADPAWRDAWRAFAEPVEVGQHLLVAPAWRAVPIASGRLVLRIDPGPCFGSGSHPSTRLVLAALDRQPPSAGAAVLDVGCGSGILSVAAVGLGAASVTAVDIDPAAVQATNANAAANGVATRVQATASPIADITGCFDLALVNVTAAVHAVLGPVVTGLVVAGGRIVVSGLLPGQWRHVAGAYRGATVARREELDGWEGLELHL